MRPIIVVSIIAAFAASCKKESDSTPETLSQRTSAPSSYDYMPMKAGNYWVYEHFNVDSSGNATSMETTDSVWVDGDTLIGGNRYFRIVASNMIPGAPVGGMMLRDSSGCLVDHQGNVLLSATNFNDTLNKNEGLDPNGLLMFRHSDKMEKGGMVNVPAGNFDVVDLKGTIVTYGKWAAGRNPRYQHNYYAKNTGLVKQSCVFIDGHMTVERRLVRYETGK